MKPASHYLKVSALLLMVFSFTAMTCNKHIMLFTKKSRITVTPKEIVNITGKLEFSATLEYNTEDAKMADSLEVRFYLTNSQIETLLGSIKDKEFSKEPRARELKKTFKTTWFSKVPITQIEVQTIFYRKGKFKEMPRFSVGEIVSKPGDLP